MKKFSTKFDMMKAFANTAGIDFATGIIEAEIACRYLPQHYRGGYIIPGFGYTVERIVEGLVTKEEAGDPQLLNLSASVQ